MDRAFHRVAGLLWLERLLDLRLVLIQVRANLLLDNDDHLGLDLDLDLGLGLMRVGRLLENHR